MALWLKVLLFTVVLCLLALYINIIKENKKTNGIKNIVTTKICDQIDPGLHKIKVDDSTTVLIYRGVESSTMIEIK